MIVGKGEKAHTIGNENDTIYFYPGVGKWKLGSNEGEDELRE